MTDHESAADFVERMHRIHYEYLTVDEESRVRQLLRRAVTPAPAEDVWRTVSRAIAQSLNKNFDFDEAARAAIAAMPHAPDHWCACDIPIQAADDTSLCDRCRRKLIARVTDGAERQRGLLEALLREVLDKGLIYWEPQTERGHIAKADMMARCEAAIRERAAAARPGEAPDLTTPYTPVVVDFPEAGFSELVLADCLIVWEASDAHGVEIGRDTEGVRVGVRWPLREEASPSHRLPEKSHD